MLVLLLMDQTTRWCHYKDMLTALMAFCEGNPLGTGGFPSQWVNAPRKDQWRGALLISLMCASTTGWTNSQDAGDLKRHDAHCDVTVMSKRIFGFYLKVNCSVRTTLFILFFYYASEPMTLGNVKLVKRITVYHLCCFLVVSTNMLCRRFEMPWN